VYLAMQWFEESERLIWQAGWITLSAQNLSWTGKGS
jgi:hypothetical protein